METASGVSPDTWRTATWSVPLVFQVVLTLFLLTTWATRKWVLVGDTFRTTMSAGAATSAVVSLMISIVLFRARSSRLRGVGLAVAGSAAAVLIGWIIAAFWIYQ
ncbi:MULTISPECIES: hypothetical protein [Mycolicibacterium]|uniref:hypothetical protein n=1 Tax=Mycolicibacterium TaxID=1866885 RepID=UPI0007EBCA4D|nr:MULTISPECIES: hypothetical protein [Mycolicibacterium]NOP99313.1 hypothetical protein [Mycolicibacterium fortuitum]OBA92174.1 hypothetical protein A5665_12435 [Mycolicibacterium fortuitum]OBI57698.1 hypothetical protein A5667_19450 [Mycolicibacterium fortuitum]OBI71148.1 hypothetical protein A5666_21640 [Mycolicibacterium fortuitum]OBK10844.1 hypothetical protein A5637_26015 [Mycolicibacterium fortuitum]